MIGLEQLERLWRSLLGLGARRLAALGVVGLSVFAMVAFGSFYLSRPELETIYTGLNPQDVGRIGAALKDAGIPFDVNAAGTAVLVRYGQTAQARMLLAEKGLPSSSTAGYELFDKMGSMGLTSFMQEITRVRALEGEIARSIQAMRGVKAARVHLVMPDTGSFRRTKQAPSASVIVRTENAGDFAAAAAIRHLVSSAVPGMTVDQVTVLNMDGTILASGGDSFNAAPGKTVTLEKAIANDLQENIAKTLMPYLGMDNFRISVAARVNTDKRQTNETQYNPEQRVERSVRVVKETGASQNSNNKQAVGAEQNVPADQPAQAAGDQSKRTNERREEVTNYEVSTKTTATVSEGYRIDNLTVAVVLNRKRLLASLGDNPRPEALEKQLKELEQIVGSAAGIDTKRGDRITVSALDFVQGGQVLEPVPSLGFVEQLVRQAGSLVNALGLIVVTALLIWFGVRPAMRAILEAPQPAVAEARLGVPPMANASSGLPGGAQVADTSLISDLTSKLERAPQKRLEQMVEFDEEQAAAILKQMMRGANSA
jgi:flagellar M-ring protein FliF